MRIISIRAGKMVSLIKLAMTIAPSLICEKSKRQLQLYRTIAFSRLLQLLKAAKHILCVRYLNRLLDQEKDQCNANCRPVLFFYLERTISVLI